jgi:hypothetical protein
MELPTYTEYAEAEQARVKLHIELEKTTREKTSLTHDLKRNDWYTNMPLIKLHEATIKAAEDLLKKVQDNAANIRESTPEVTIDFVELPMLISGHSLVSKQLESILLTLIPRPRGIAEWVLAHSSIQEVENDILRRNLSVEEINELEFDQYAEFTDLEIMMYSELKLISQEDLETFYTLLKLSSVKRQLGERIDKYEN